MSEQTVKIEPTIKEIETTPDKPAKPTVIKKFARKRLIVMTPPVRAK